MLFLIMATAQTDKPTETVEELLEKANRAALAQKKAIEQSPAIPPLSVEEIDRLDTMDVETLRILIRKLYKAGWGFGGLTGKELLEAALMAKDDAYDALMVKGLALALAAKEWREYKELATFWAERERGKPVGSAQQINIGGGSGPTKIEVVLVNAADYRKQQEAAKIIEGQLIG